MRHRKWLLWLVVVAVGVIVGVPLGMTACGTAAGQFWASRDWPTTAESFANLAQIIALVVAAWWTYSLFIRQRHDREHANLTHTVIDLGSDGEHRLIRVQVTIQNIGNVVLSPPKGAVKLYQVLPLEDPVRACFTRERKEEEPRVNPVECEFPWKRIAKVIFTLGPESMVLEPGESDALACDFCVPLAIEAIFVRSELFCGYLDNSEQHWHNETFHKLVESPSPARV